MKLFRHFITITRHRHAVIRNAFSAGILWQGLFHDLSKYSPTEFFAGVKNYTDGTRSPNEREREIHGYSRAWMHHKGRNRHHFEYWVDISPETKNYEPVKMPLRYLAEMFCDRVAASEIYQGKAYTDAHPLQYFERGRARNYMHKETAEHLHYWLTVLAEKGRREAFATVKKEVRAKKEY